MKKGGMERGRKVGREEWRREGGRKGKKERVIE